MDPKHIIEIRIMMREFSDAMGLPSQLPSTVQNASRCLLDAPHLGVTIQEHCNVCMSMSFIFCFRSFKRVER